jgi:RNA polymerase sigma-70 factor, ECF subfamily
MDIPSTHASLFVAFRSDRHAQEIWAALHTRYHHVILTWCRRRGLTEACSEDLTQEIWLKLLRQIPTFDAAKGRFRSWLKAVVNNALTDWWRQQGREPVRGGVGGTAFLEQLVNQEAADELSDAIEQQANHTAADVLARVKARLHETTWQAFYQTLFERRPAKEVAEALGLSVSAVYKDTYRVKQMLHKEYLHVHANDHETALSGRGDSAAVPG